MRWTCLSLALLVFTFLPAHAGHSPPKIVLRVHVQTTGEGQSPMEATAIALPPNGEKIMVRTLPEATEQQIVAVEPTSSGGMRIQFNHVGQVALSAVTAQNTNRILVVLINGYVVYAPVIDQQITSGELDIPSGIPPQAVKMLQDQAAKNVRQAQKT